MVVRRLFFNVPARRKFLKRVETEMGHVTTLVSNMALARPDVHITLVHNGKIIFDLPASSDLSSRLRHALGAEALRSLIPADRHFDGVLSRGSLRVHGFVSAPSYTRTSTRSLHVFVNQRFVRDRLINHAVFEAYRGLAPKGRYPLVVLFIDLPVDSVDVNVHPSKHEIRFQDQAQVHESVKNVIVDALKSSDRAGAEVLPEEVRVLPFRGRPSSGAEDVHRSGNVAPGDGVEMYDQGEVPARDPELKRGVTDALKRYYGKMERGGEAGAATFPRPGTSSGHSSKKARAPARKADGVGEPLADLQRGLPGIDFSKVNVIGQAAGTYVLAEFEDSLLIIDQHAAHERMMFEKISGQFRSESIARQPLLFPTTVDLTYEEARRVEENLETLVRLGLEVEPFGGSTVAVKALPALLSGADPVKLLLDVVDRMGDVKGGAGALDERFEEIFAVMACHSVVRAHERMELPEMAALVKSMDDLEFPGHCPHGRDVVVRIRFKDLEKWFGR
jgi:DNA mismatch repair protein MutL